ncbi:MAG: hypothetical protein CL943_03010 [Candidatus Diapherotrites archaeon]|uniref:CBS domain-containing protein n=1 Tax=Candidatus Iainarchaeum sp. TaxID=3101447 RepID=A0A2D6M1I3_9ARCH|nr:hypothetical protein [Candidatus Diapherotrites archaeon]
MEKGFKVQKIILLPIGGISVSESLPEKPGDEFQVSIAGPLFNFFVAGSILVIASVFNIPLGLEKLAANAGFEAVFESPLLSLFYVNVVLGAFNLFFPALPLDGGRVARSLLAYFIGWRKATRIISRVSIVLAVLLFIISFLEGAIIAAVIAIFIFFGSQQENKRVEIKETLRGTSLLPILEKRSLVVQGDDNLQDIFATMIQNRRLALLVKLGQGFGLVSFETLEKMPRGQWPNVKAKTVAQPLPTVQIDADPAELMEKVMTKGYSIFPIVQQHELIGVIYARDLQKLYEIEKLKHSP